MSKNQKSTQAINPETESFKHHYDNLKSVSEKMRNQQEPDIDSLVPLVDSGLESYAFCKARLEKVKAILGEKLPGELGS